MNTIFIFITILLFSTNSFGVSKKYYANQIQYRTFFGNCPSKAVGRLALTLMREFEKEKSLLDIKKKIINEKLEDKYFLSSYKINYSPAQKMIRFDFDCPKPLMNVQIYKSDGDEFYTAVLVDSGKLFDPTYEVLLRSEKKIKNDLPHLAFPASKLNTELHKRITSLLNKLGEDFTEKVSEIILSEKEELTIILSIGSKPSSAFFGKEFWEEKAKKLQKIVKYMNKKKTIPSTINLKNSKKVVVKFSDTK